MMRSTVLGAVCVCSVANTRWPVSAAVIAVEIVSRSRISPRRITSGSWRRAARRASPNDVASVHDATLVTVEELDGILDRDDVVVAHAIDLVDHRRERRRLTGAGRAG